MKGRAASFLGADCEADAYQCMSDSVEANLGVQERSRRLEARREGERKRRRKEAADLEARRAEAEERARMKVRPRHHPPLAGYKKKCACPPHVSAQRRFASWYPTDVGLLQRKLCAISEGRGKGQQ